MPNAVATFPRTEPTVDIRNLEQIQEQDHGYETKRLVPWLLASAGGGAIALSVALSLPQNHETTAVQADPLGDLIAQVKSSADSPPAPGVLSGDEASFSRILSDRERKSTALVAVQSGNGTVIPLPAPRLEAPAPWAGDRLPIVPLPAGKLLDSTAVIKRPTDPLLTLAADRARISNTDTPVEAGSGGQYQIQVASFRTETDANQYTRELRLRGYRAHRQEARVPNRGVWYRVRIGPFKHKYLAARFKTEFERKEHVATLLVDPYKVERQRTQRAAKLAARARRKKRRNGR